MTSPSFADSWLPGSQSTGYVVTQVDAYGNESSFSAAVVGHDTGVVEHRCRRTSRS